MEFTAMRPAPPPFVDPLRTPPVVQVPNQQPDAQLTVCLRAVSQRFHSALKPTTVWGYDGQVPGPTFNVRAGSRVSVRWKNEIAGALPFPVYQVPTSDPGDPLGENAIPQNNPGPSGGAPDEKVAKLHAWTVTHLHGGHNPPDSDGWPTNAALERQQVTHRYEFDQRATMLWYHDHAMHVTRFNVYAGLAGMWFIRDNFDDAILKALRDAHGHKPKHKQTPLEIPLMIQDRNLGLGDDDNLDGSLVYKVEDGALPDGAQYPAGPMEFFGPYTLVNGGLWPHVKVKRGPYRLRVLNGSNARTFQLVLRNADGSTASLPGIKQIGTDGGLMAEPVEVDETSGLIVSPAERADLIIDFSGCENDARISWVNIAAAPYSGSASPSEKNLENRIPFPDVMQFQVEGEKLGLEWKLPSPLSDFTPLDHQTLGQHNHRLIGLREESDPRYAGLLTLWELEKLSELSGVPAADQMSIEFDVMAVTEADRHKLTHYAIRSRLFDDQLNFTARLGEYEIWHVVNLSPDTHPFHVHLVQFQVMSREEYISLDATTQEPLDPTQTPIRYVGSIPNAANEAAWKDTIRVNPNEKVSIAMRFDGFAGRYVYHCHILEHEDHDMMRPYDVLPPMVADIMHGMPMPGDSGAHPVGTVPSSPSR